MERSRNDLEPLLGRSRRVEQRAGVGGEVVRRVLVLLRRDIERGNAETSRSGKRVELARDRRRSGDGDDSGERRASTEAHLELRSDANAYHVVIEVIASEDGAEGIRHVERRFEGTIPRRLQ